MGYLYPGRPVANMCFKVYGYVAPRQALAFLQDFKLGHYMKIPPRTMFMAQVSYYTSHMNNDRYLSKIITFNFPIVRINCVPS
jgi:hypothetical protein